MEILQMNNYFQPKLLCFILFFEKKDTYNLIFLLFLLQRKKTIHKKFWSKEEKRQKKGITKILIMADFVYPQNLTMAQVQSFTTVKTMCDKNERLKQNTHIEEKKSTLIELSLSN